MFEDTASIPMAAMSGKGDDVFNDPKRPGTTRQVGNDREHAGGHQRLPELADDHMKIVARDKATECLPGSIVRQFWIVRPQFPIKREDSEKVLRLSTANCCVHVDLTFNGQLWRSSATGGWQNQP